MEWETEGGLIPFLINKEFLNKKKYRFKSDLFKGFIVIC